MAANKNTDWRAKYRAMMTDPDFANKASEAVENTRKVNTDLMNKSEEFKSSLSLDKPTSKPLDLSRVEQMQTEQAARATMQGEDSDYSGVSDLATKLYAEERKKRIDNAQQGSNTYFGAPHGMRFSQAASDIRDEELAKRVQGIYDKVLQDKSLSQAIHSNANKALLNAMEKNQSMSEDEQKKVYNESVTKQLEAIGKGIDKYLYDTNAPKSEAEWIAKNAVNSSIMGQMLTSPMNVEGGENVYRQQALADYGANASWLSQGLSTAGSLVIDTLPMMGIGAAFATPASKAAMWGVGKVGGRALQGSLAGRGFVGLVGGAANLGGYNAASALTTQFSNGQFDLGEIASSAGHGAIMGGLTGVMSPVLRGLSQGMGKVGKVATMAGGLGAEAGVFTAAELAEMENPYDFETIAQTFGKNVAVIGGLKLSNLPKTLQEYKGWYNEGKQSNFTDADYKMMADFAKANGFANNEAFSMGADGTYSRSIADRVTGNRTLLELTKLEGGKERNLAMEMYQDPNVPLSMKTKIAAKMGLPAPNPVLPNAVEARDNVVNTYYEYREQMSDGTYVTRRILVDSKEMPSKRKARAAASEFGRTKARQNSIIQSEAEANTDATNAIVMARLTEQAWRSGTNVSDEVARMYDIAQRAQRGEASAEDIAYYQSVMEGTTEVTDRIKADIKAKTGVDIDEVLKQEGTFNTAQDKALTMYGEALASLKDNSKPTTERGTTASQASIADYIELKGMGIEQTKQLLNDPTSKVAAEKEIRSKYNLWLKYFDGQMSEEQLATRLGYNLDSTKGLMDFVNEEAFFRGKAANRIAYNASNTAKRLLEQGSGGVRFTEDGKVKLQGVPYSIAVDESIVDRYRAAQQGSGENYQRIANDALKDIIRQSEQPIEEMLQQMATDEQAIDVEPQTEQDAVTQQMVDNRLAEIDTDLQGIEADGIQRVNINDKPAMIVKGRIATIGDGEIDRAKSSTEVAYIPLDENGRPIKNEQGKPVVEVGVKPSNVRISEVEQWRTVEDYKRAEEERIRDNNRITDEAITQVGAEGSELKEEMPTLDNVVVEPKDADELVAMCDGDKGLALDVAVDELAKAQAAKGKGASTAETIDINRRIRTYQQIVDRLSASEMPDAAVDVESEQKGEQAKAEPQVTDDMEFIYQQGLDENHEGMEPMQTSDGRYKWVGLQRGELTATMGERDVELLDGLAKKLGVAVIPINVADSAVNGYYRDGNVYVNTNRGADWTMRWVAGHELLHDVAKKSPEAYDAYKQAVLDMWGSDYIDDQVKQIIDDYAASGKTIDREQALTELVNDFGGELFNSRDGLNILDNILKDESRKGNTGFVNTIKQWWERLKEWFGVTPYANEVEKKLADAYKSAMKVMADRMGKRKVVEQQELATIGGLKDEAVADDAISNEGAEMSIVRDRNKIEELEGEELVPMLRTFQILDGALYSPMATIQRGKKVHSVVEGDWWKSDENPDLAKVKVKGKKDEFYDKDDDRISKKDGQWVITIDGEDKPLATNGNSLSYYFNLKKGEKGDVVTDDLDVSYNPYIHSSKSALNDQFKGAYLRPNLALVEVLVPKSELDGTNHYKADYAKDGIGEVDWNSGTVIKQAVAAGHPGRKVALSRYAKIGKVFTDAEWADKIDEELSAYKGQITLPFIAFPPDVLRELANRGYKVKPPTSKKAQPYYEKWLNGEQLTDPNGGKPNTEFSIKADKQKQFDIISSINPMRDDYHTGIRKADDILTLQEAIEASKQENGEGIISTYPDVDESVYNEALQSGKIKVYSSKPIENGAFVGPSMMQAKDYAGGGKVYSKEVNVSDIAWINADEGVYASLGKRADESVLDYAKRMSEETGKKNLLNGGSYFSGGGLLEEGLKGIVNPTIAVEFNQKVAGVYRNNFGEHIVTADVRNVDPASLVKNIDGPVAYFHASPVCKNFSKAKQSAEELPLDKATAQSTAEFISKVRPKIVTIENVKGYRDSESMKIILGELKKQGYNYDVDVYNAADYGAYTSRERLIVRAVRDWSLPAKPMVMLADDRPSGWLEAVADIIDTLPEKKGGVAKWMDERLMAMGIDYRNIDKPLYVFGSGYSKDRIGYAFADELVPTLRTKGGDVIVMPDGRVLKATPRVLARISGMSDEYEMPKTDDLAHTIVGNGIPVQLTKAVMGSLIENVKSDLDAGNTEYSIIGKRGAANLDKRDETSIRVDNMVTAEEMEKAGKDAKTIRMATGWERGADGKWRYEVKDLSMLPAEQWIGKRNKKLSDIVENADELFAAYPELANVKIKEGNGKTYGGSYSSGVITLDTYLAKLWMKRLPDSLPRANKYMNEALIHEIQHYIQGEEGFARGGNESMVLDKDAVSKISALIDDSNKLATQYNNMIERGVYEGREAVKDEIIALRAKANAIRNSNKLGSYGYKSLAGEVEARNVEKRLGMAGEERKKSLLADTEDVGRDEQIVYGNTDDEYSIKIRGKEYRNDGYTQREDGTNVSVRALDAEENGTHSKGNFIKAYKVAKKDFDLLASLGVIKNTEWHHTGTNFAKTDFYSWADSQKADGNVEYGELAEIDPNSMAELYKKNKKEIGQLTDEYNNAKWGPLAKEREKLPTIEYITERYIRVSNPEKYSLSDWLTKEEKNSKSAEHEEISRGGEAYGTSYERRQMHEGVDNKYNKIAYDRKKEWAESHKDDIRRRYDEIAARVEKYNAEILPLEDVFANDAKGKPLMKLLEMFGYSADDAAKKIYHLQYQYYSNTIDERMAEASEKVRKEYDAKIESARVDFNKWLSKALKDGKAEFVERVPSEPENFITTKEEMNGRYGWFEASSRYNLPRYYSGYKFKTKRMYDSYKKREEDIFKIELEQISKTQEASNNVYNEYLKASHAVREDLVEKPLVQGDYSIKGGNTPKKQADEVARLKQKIEQLSQEKDAIAEDGAKVKDIASEMTSFIKQNISTEVQSDMTRNQFKGILNQLETAVTKKDLEKPMQMIEHIGTNVTRRSLTRQMRNFLKSEFKAMTPQGAVKAKTVDGATSRVLELAKTMYATMNKLPLGGEVAALQKQMRDLKTAVTEWAKDQSADTKNLLADVLKVTERPAATRYNELAELRNKVAADGSASGEMLGYIDHMLDIMGDIDYFRGEQQKAKEASALNSKEDLEALKSELLDKSDKGILSEEDKAVLDNMPLYEMMVNLRQQQLDIDGGGAASIDAQIRNKQNAIKAYRAKMNELPKTDTAGRERYKALIEQVGGEIDDLFASRIVDQKAVNNGMRELIDDLVTLKEQGHSRLVEWSKGKQERSNGIRKLANDSFSSTARGYWDEVNKKGHRLRDINNFLNNAKLTVISPALSFEYMLGTLDKKYYTNDSPIYNRFIKSQDGLLKANDNFFEGLEAYNKEVNAAANRLIGRGAITNMAEWFKLGDRFATEKIPFAFEVDQMFDDGTVRKVTKGITATMTRGQAAKIYAWSRMADGMAKLKAHGVTDDTIAAVKDFIGEGYMRFIDWVEDDFFPRLRREKYNPKYKEIYGISMAENEHYFPFAIYKKDVRTDTDLEQIGDDKLGGGLVGNLIERKRNNARLDFTRNSPDIFDMITRYGETMEEWTAYAQVREDLKAMVNDKMFKTKCDMFGTDYYKHFLEAARVASRTSDDKALAGKWNTSMSKLQKVLASGAISMRVSTALKQLLSAPAFAVYSLDPKFLHQLEKTVVPIDVESAIKGLWKIGSGDLAEAKKLLLNENWVGHYNWCVNNLPSFRERVSLGGAGNPILEEKGFFKLCDAVQSLGMIPNRLIDAYTCSVGAKAVYEYNFNKYKKMYGEKAAHNMAVTEAEIAFNSSQQSSNPVFLSPMQVSKQFLLRGLMNFKNSPIGYLRAGLKANIDIVRAIKSIYNPTFKVDGQEMRFNSNGKNAASMLMTAAARSAMYNFFLNFIWNLGTVGIAGLSYTAIRNLSGEGNEDGNLLYTDEEWKKATGDNLASTLFLCATQGLPYISGPFATAEQGTEFAPLMLLNTLNEMGTDIYKNGLVSPVTAQWIVNIALKYRTGIDPQVCAQAYEGLQGILADRPVTEEDIMNLLASPRSAISGMTKQKVGEFDRMRDYVDARIKSNREIGIDERMDFGKALVGKRELRKSNLDYYIDEYLEANIPGYREISGRKSKETKQEEQANKKLYEQSMSLVEKIVSTPKGEADEQKSSKIDSEDYDTKYKVRKLRDAVAAIHKLYAAGDFGTAEDIAAEMQRRIERGYDPNGKTLDERLKNVDIWKPAVEVKQRTADGYSTNFDRAIGGVFKKMYVGKMNGEGN